MVGVTIGVGDWWREAATLGAARAKHYLGIDTIILTEDHMQRFGVAHPWWLKTIVFDLVPNDTVLYFDADLIWSDHWDLSPYEFRPELCCARDLCHAPWIAGEADKIDIHPRDYFNAGLFIANAEHHLAWMQMTMRLAIDKRTASFSWFDQSLMNLARASSQTPVHFLPQRFNFICDPQLVGFADEVGLVGVHMAGCSKRELHRLLSAPLDCQKTRSYRTVDLPDTFLGAPVWYERVGHDFRPLQLEPDGTIGFGGARCETRWAAFEGEQEQFLSLFGSNTETCRLIRTTATRFSGRWLAHERMPVELTTAQDSRTQTWTRDSAIELIRSLDYRNRITTASEHCIQLFDACTSLRCEHALELGAGHGISGVAIGLACPDADVLVVDDCREVSPDVPIRLWERYGIRKRFVQGQCLQVMRSLPRDKFDFVFHDASHGPNAIPEYDTAWRVVRPGGILAIHDVDQFDFGAWMQRLPQATASVTLDDRGRQLAIVRRAS